MCDSSVQREYFGVYLNLKGEVYEVNGGNFLESGAHRDPWEPGHSGTSESLHLETFHNLRRQVRKAQGPC